MASTSEQQTSARDYSAQPLPLVFEPEPPRHVATEITPGVRRIVASNPGAMTYHGTNTYLVEQERGALVIDPGPDAPGHLEDLVRATSAIDAIFITHHHRDHVGIAGRLRDLSGAPIVTFESFKSNIVQPDIRLGPDEELHGLKCVHTPGHASDHMCIRWGSILFSGDHVMAWATTSVTAPDGSMADYMLSLRILLDGHDRLFLPGHGPPLERPRELVASLLSHRIAREADILDLLRSGPMTPSDITRCLYQHVDSELIGAAERVVTAHLLKLCDEGVASPIGDVWTVR